MARWNLRRAAAPRGEAWTSASGGAGSSWPTRSSTDTTPRPAIYEQFAGFHALEPLVIAEVAPAAAGRRRPAARRRAHPRGPGGQAGRRADAALPRARRGGARLARPNLDFYEPRTAHGSTLSPGVHAALLARAGRLEQALELLRLTARIDLDDIGHTTAGGLHLAAMGSVWRALALRLRRPAADR